MGLLDILSELVKDPYQQGGGWAYGLLNPAGATAASTDTPATPPPASPAAGSPFSFRPGLFGDSFLGRIIHGGLAGLAGSTGYIQ